MAETYRTNPAVRFSWRPGDGRLVATVGTDDVETTPVEDPALLAALEFALEPRSRTELVEYLAADVGCSRHQSSEHVSNLRATGLLLPDGDRAADYRFWVEHGWDRSLLYHLSTNDPGFDGSGNERAGNEQVVNEEVVNEEAGSKRAGSEETRSGGAASEEIGSDEATSTETRSDGAGRDETPPESGNDDVDVALPDPLPLPERPLHEVLLERRTCREFAGETVETEALSSLLHHTSEPVRCARESGTDAVGTEFFEMAAFPVGLYPVVVRSESLARGVYRYDPAEHGLRLRRSLDGSPAAIDDRLQAVTVNQPWVRDAGVVLLVTADLAAVRRRYRDPAAFRYLCTLLSGHAHRLLVTATAYGFDVFQAAALEESRAEDLLGVDGFDEPVLYVVAVGTGVDDG